MLNGWEFCGEGYPCWLHTARNWKKLDIAFLKFLSFDWGLQCHCVKKTSHWESSFMQLASLLAQEQERVNWEEQ